MKWNNYFYGIVNPLFGMGIFLGIVILIGITNPIHTGITIPLKNEWNNYSLWYGMNFTKKLFIIFYFSILFSCIFSPSKHISSSI
jgi:hypothetical protein